MTGRADHQKRGHDRESSRARPPWLAALAARVQTADGHRGSNAVASSRPAAVLVLLIDDPHGPQLLLTVRAAALSNYPGYLVFPGGAAEPADNGPAATALREAAEELALDPRRVHVIGQLQTIAVPATGFSVTPVLAWCTALDVTGPTNPDEVSAVVTVPLAELARPSARVRRVEATDATGPAWHVDGHPVGPMTASIIEFVVGSA